MSKVWVGIMLFVGTLGYLHYQFLMMNQDMVDVKDQLNIMEQQMYPGADVAKLHAVLREKQVDREKEHRLMNLIKESIAKAKEYMKDTLKMTEQEINEIFHRDEASDDATAKDDVKKDVKDKYEDVKKEVKDDAKSVKKNVKEKIDSMKKDD
ncbi:MAG: hypothetical protein IPP74_04775 [Alphaproteobacteria bacterium]|nr:hypothetical protein [Alphaproteobacteria bacterium]